MKKYFYSFFFFILSLLPIQAQNWNLVWSDEFNSSTIDTKNWTFETGAGGWGNNELQNYTKRAENATIKNGNLLIIARKESYQGSDYTSARMKTQDLHSWTYGKVEANIKVPVGQGTWPAFWMLGSNITTVSWPGCGEIDIMEHVNKDPKLLGTMHWDNNGHAQWGGNVTFNPETYHVYSIEWDASSIKWLLDGTQYFEGNIANNINGTDEFHKPFFVLLNMAIGGDLPHAPDNTTLFPDTMFVDYVRVYQDGITTDIQEWDLVSSPKTLSVSPNPTKGNAVLHYTLLSAGEVEFSMYDALGREILVLVQGEQSSGEHSVDIHLDKFEKGVYLVKGNIEGRVHISRIFKE